MNENTKFIVCAFGIFFSYFYFAIIQERITRGSYGEEINEDGTKGERFTFTLALVGVQCLVNWMFAKGMLLARPQKQDTTHTGYYASSALTYLLAMISSNMALRWVPYPTQVKPKHNSNLNQIIQSFISSGRWKISKTDSCYDPWSINWSKDIRNDQIHLRTTNRCWCCSFYVQRW